MDCACNLASWRTGGSKVPVNSMGSWCGPQPFMARTRPCLIYWFRAGAKPLVLIT